MRLSVCSILIITHALLSCRAASVYQHSRDVSSQHFRPQPLDQLRVSPPQHSSRRRGGGGGSSSISTSLFAELERLARLVDISYCVGNTGVSKPFQCLSRCKEFPELVLETTWSTGFLLGDSCGYIALDHGCSHPGSGRRSGGESTDTETETQTQTQTQTETETETRKRVILVAFRGTYSIANTIVDLSTVPQKYVPYPAPDDGGGGTEEQDTHSPPQQARGRECDNCTVHMGFLQSWQLARETVVPRLKALKKKYPSYQIQLVGHSLGGAVACLAALELKLSLGWDDLVVTTFGEPRIGNYHLARYIDTAFSLDDDDNDVTSHPEQRSYRRVTHNNDPVPLLPLEEWGYRSHAGEVYIEKQELQPSETDVRTCVGDADPECSTGGETSLLESVRRLLHFASPSTSVDEYIAARTLPTRLRLWQLFFAHRDYFWRLGLFEQIAQQRNYFLRRVGVSREDRRSALADRASYAERQATRLWDEGFGFGSVADAVAVAVAVAVATPVPYFDHLGKLI
ncbi:hypothetical protein E4U43_003657 [Claviceps pusilla]|uniref:Fungal lipase-type domain-containing protein n=1 Tax=Claviceps pusilla TaxID=123648 RepID=A0A9P7N540_9HYPO|nr:hypothetical protein E4U43_003657 [Claviceps pusilla]